MQSSSPRDARVERYHDGGSIRQLQLAKPDRIDRRNCFDCRIIDDDGNLMKIYTRTGDAGTTGLFAGPRISKDDQRIEAFGTVDELNSVIGVCRSHRLDQDLDEQFRLVQSDLFTIGARLATTQPEKLKICLVGPTDVARLEDWIDHHEAMVPPLEHFILPAGNPASASVHHARTVARRAERRVVSLAKQSGEDGFEQIVVFLNRLSDYLFVVARVLNYRGQVEESIWTGKAEGSGADVNI